MVSLPHVKFLRFWKDHETESKSGAHKHDVRQLPGVLQARLNPSHLTQKFVADYVLDVSGHLIPDFWAHPGLEFPPGIPHPFDSEGWEIKVEIQKTHFAMYSAKN